MIEEISKFNLKCGDILYHVLGQKVSVIKMTEHERGKNAKKKKIKMVKVRFQDNTGMFHVSEFFPRELHISIEETESVTIEKMAEVYPEFRIRVATTRGMDWNGYIDSLKKLTLSEDIEKAHVWKFKINAELYVALVKEKYGEDAVVEIV
jgi:hypothetical protein